MTLNEAFEQMIGKRAWYKNIPNVTPQYANNLKKRYLDGTMTDDTKRDLLNKSGAFYSKETWYPRKA